MGCSAISYRTNAIPLELAKPMYYLPIESADYMIDWDARPKWDTVVDVEEFDNRKYTFKFKDGTWLQVQGNKSTSWTN